MTAAAKEFCQERASRVFLSDQSDRWTESSRKSSAAFIFLSPASAVSSRSSEWDWGSGYSPRLSHGFPGINWSDERIADSLSAFIWIHRDQVQKYISSLHLRYSSFVLSSYLETYLPHCIPKPEPKIRCVFKWSPFFELQDVQSQTAPRRDVARASLRNPISRVPLSQHRRFRKWAMPGHQYKKVFRSLLIYSADEIQRYASVSLSHAWSQILTWFKRHDGFALQPAGTANFCDGIMLVVGCQFGPCEFWVRGKGWVPLKCKTGSRLHDSKLS